MKRLALIVLVLFAACARIPPPEPPVVNGRDAVVSPLPHRGLDLLGLAMEDVPMIAGNIEPDTMIGVLEGTFGNAIPPLEALINTGKVTAFRAHLVNWSCRRGNNCEKGEPNTSDYPAVISARASRYEALAGRHPGVRCYLSPLLEYDERNPANVLSWARAAAKAAPSCQVVLSPSGSGVTPPGWPVERHGSHEHGFGVSGDGANTFDSNTLQFRNAGSEYSLAWIPSFNLRYGVESKWTPPSKRTRKSTRAEIVQAVAVMKAPSAKPIGVPPGCHDMRDVGMELVKDRTGKSVWVATKELYKPNAEERENPDVRKNKPLLISKRTEKQLGIISPTGAPAGCLRFFDTYSPYGPGWMRHYTGSCDGQAAGDLYKKAGEWAYVKEGGTCVLINTVRKSQSFN